MKTREEIEAMSDEERRIKTAELCGWKRIVGSQPYWKKDGKRIFMDGFEHETPFPNYLADLNAMAEAEEIPSTYRLADEWIEALRVVAAYDAGLPREILEGGPVSQTVCSVIRLSARQRNTAFLMVML